MAALDLREAAKALAARVPLHLAESAANYAVLRERPDLLPPDYVIRDRAAYFARVADLAGGPEPVALSDKERAAMDALTAEQERLVTEHEGYDELPEAVDDRLGEIEAALEELGDRPLRYDPDEVARAGVFVNLGHEGRLHVERDYVRPEDEAPVAPENGEAGDGGEGGTAETPSALPAIQRAIITIGGSPTATAPEPEEEDGIRPLPDRLLAELTAHRTLALRDAVGGDPQVALTALLHKLVLDTFRFRSAEGCLEATVRQVHPIAQAEDLKDSASACAVAERHAGWKAVLPEDDDALWDRLVALDEAICKAWADEPSRFTHDPHHQIPGPNI